MNTKKLSIVTINYNNIIGLQKTFDSIKNQTWLDFEFIVIDGGSTDGSLELIKNNKQISYWISEKDNGVYHAMNKGILAANGEYVNFMNSGDFFYDNFVLEKVKKHLDKGISVLFGNTTYFNNDGYHRHETPPQKLSFKFMSTSGINHQATFIKHDLFQKHFYYNEAYKICSDWEFFILIFCQKNETYLHVGEYICFYDFSGISADPKNLEKYHEERDLTLKKYFPLFLDDYKIIEELNNRRIRNILHIKKYRFPWKLLKGFSNFLLLFIPKQKKSE